MVDKICAFKPGNMPWQIGSAPTTLYVCIGDLTYMNKRLITCCGSVVTVNFLIHEMISNSLMVNFVCIYVACLEILYTCAHICYLHKITRAITFLFKILQLRVNMVIDIIAIFIRQPIPVSYLFRFIMLLPLLFHLDMMV